MLLWRLQRAHAPLPAISAISAIPTLSTISALPALPASGLLRAADVPARDLRARAEPASTTSSGPAAALFIVIKLQQSVVELIEQQLHSAAATQSCALAAWEGRHVQP